MAPRRYPRGAHRAARRALPGRRRGRGGAGGEVAHAVGAREDAPRARARDARVRYFKRFSSRVQGRRDQLARRGGAWVGAHRVRVRASIRRVVRVPSQAPPRARQVAQGRNRGRESRSGWRHAQAVYGARGRGGAALGRVRHAAR